MKSDQEDPLLIGVQFLAASQQFEAALNTGDATAAADLIGSAALMTRDSAMCVYAAAQATVYYVRERFGEGNTAGVNLETVNPELDPDQARAARWAGEMVTAALNHDREAMVNLTEELIQAVEEGGGPALASRLSAWWATSRGIERINASPN